MHGSRFTKTFAISAAAVCAGALSVTGAPAFASGAPVTQVTTYTVDAASETPVDIGTINRQFTSITITAVDGTGSYGTGESNGPSGIDTTCGYAAANWIDRDPNLCPAPDAPLGALVYRVGTSGPWMPYSTAPMTSKDSVQDVYLVFNDVSGTYGDNSGSYTVTVTRTKP